MLSDVQVTILHDKAYRPDMQIFFYNTNDISCLNIEYGLVKVVSEPDGGLGLANCYLVNFGITESIAFHMI